jgi:uncharacterized protein (UPF0332 family)
LADRKKWNSTINRLYYACYYAISALLLNSDITATTHNGIKSIFSERFVRNNIIPKDLAKFYSQLFTWRQKGDYDDLFDFSQDKVLPYFEPVQRLIAAIDSIILKTPGGNSTKKQLLRIVKILAFAFQSKFLPNDRNKAAPISLLFLAADR